jgi:hypothetical protein
VKKRDRVKDLGIDGKTILILNPLKWKILWAPNDATKWQMGFNSAFKGLNWIFKQDRRVWRWFI